MTKTTLSQRMKTGDVTVIDFETIKYAEESGQRPAGYVDDYRQAAELVDEHYGMVWITREEQDRLKDKYQDPDEVSKALETLNEIQRLIKNEGMDPDDPTITEMRENMPRPFVLPPKGRDRGSALREGFAFREIQDTSQDKSQKLAEMVKNGRLTSDQAIRIKRRGNIGNTER